MTTKKVPETMLTARVPTRLVKALERAARREDRTRTAELIVRLRASLKADKERSPA